MELLKTLLSQKPRLVQIAVRGFRKHFKRKELQLARVNFLLGPNNAGKTSFFEALELASWMSDRYAQGGASQAAVRRELGLDPAALNHDGQTDKAVDFSVEAQVAIGQSFAESKMVADNTEVRSWQMETDEGIMTLFPRAGSPKWVYTPLKSEVDVHQSQEGWADDLLLGALAEFGVTIHPWARQRLMPFWGSGEIGGLTLGYDAELSVPADLRGVIGFNNGLSLVRGGSQLFWLVDEQGGRVAKPDWAEFLGLQQDDVSKRQFLALYTLIAAMEMLEERLNFIVEGEGRAATRDASLASVLSAAGQQWKAGVMRQGFYQDNGVWRNPFGPHPQNEKRNLRGEAHQTAGTLLGWLRKEYGEFPWTAGVAQILGPHPGSLNLPDWDGEKLDFSECLVGIEDDQSLTNFLNAVAEAPGSHAKMEEWLGGLKGLGVDVSADEEVIGEVEIKVYPDGPGVDLDELDAVMDAWEKKQAEMAEEAAEAIEELEKERAEMEEEVAEVIEEMGWDPVKAEQEAIDRMIEDHERDMVDKMLQDRERDMIAQHEREIAGQFNARFGSSAGRGEKGQAQNPEYWGPVRVSSSREQSFGWPRDWVQVASDGAQRTSELEESDAFTSASIEGQLSQTWEVTSHLMSLPFSFDVLRVRPDVAALKGMYYDAAQFPYEEVWEAFMNERSREGRGRWGLRKAMDIMSCCLHYMQISEGIRLQWKPRNQRLELDLQAPGADVGDLSLEDLFRKGPKRGLLADNDHGEGVSVKRVSEWGELGRQYFSQDELHREDRRGGVDRMEMLGRGSRLVLHSLLALFEASLRSRPTLVILEEPSAFLHPSMASKFTDVLRFAAQEFDVQVVVETHNEYMIRQLQTARIKGESLSDVSIHYFDGETGDVTRMNVEESGRIDPPIPEGFLDKSQTMMREQSRIQSMGKKGI